MKTKLIYTFAFVLVCAFVSTGCRHETGQLTKLPGPRPLTPPDEPSTTMPYNPGEVAQPNPTDFYNGMKMDRAALAANTIHFAYDSAAIKRSENANIQAVAQALQSNSGTKLLVEGNCDERGTEEYNRALGERRADAARNALVKLGISGDRIMTKSYGKDNPVATGHDDASRAQNRRDDFVLLHPAGGASPMGMGGS